MQKNNNSASAYIFAGLFVLAVIFIGYLLMRSEGPKSPQAKNNVSLDDLLDKPLPVIQLADKAGNEVAIESYKGKNVVLFFSEGLMCYPACWDQIAAFGSDPRFNTDDTVALSVVADSAKDWEKAIAKMPKLAGATTLFDKGAAVSKKLGLLTLSSSMHKGSLPGHTYIVVDKQGVVRYVLDDPNMALGNELMLKAIEKFNKS